MIEFLITHKPIIVVLHAIAASAGLGAVIITDTLFFKFLKDFKISKTEHETLNAISSIVWVIIGIVFVTGLGLFLSEPGGYLMKSKFVTKMIIFVVIVANGVLLNLLISPHLRKISFGPTIDQPSWRLRMLRRVAFASGAVSMVSWFSVFILGSVRSIPWSAGEALLGYILLVAGAVIGSQIYGAYLKYKRP